MGRVEGGLSVDDREFRYALIESTQFATEQEFEATGRVGHYWVIVQPDRKIVFRRKIITDEQAKKRVYGRGIRELRKLKATALVIIFEGWVNKGEADVVVITYRDRHDLIQFAGEIERDGGSRITKWHYIECELMGPIAEMLDGYFGERRAMTLKEVGHAL